MTGIDQQQLMALLNLLEQYNAGVVSSGGSGGFGTSESAPATQSGGNASQGFGNAAMAANVAAQLGQSSDLAQMSGLLGLASAVSNPNATVGSVAPSVLGVLGFGPAASLASIANTGFTTSNTLGLLGMTVNPAFGLLGLANSLAGNPFGDSIGGLGETLGNPGSMGLASDAGISIGEQLGNAADQAQIGMDTAAMDGLVAAINASDSTDSGTAVGDTTDGTSANDGESDGTNW